MDGEEAKTTELDSITSGALRAGSESTVGASGQERDTEAAYGSDDSAGIADNSSSSTGNTPEYDGQVADSEGINDASSSSTYEGVTAEDFTAYSQAVVSHLDGLTACSVVILFALFMSVGILVVNEIMVSLRG